MANMLKNAIPSSLRKPAGSSRFPQGVMGRAVKPAVVAKSDAALQATAQTTRFANLPQEPEDARLTGVTRSLNRRLLALNVGGTLLRRGVAAA